MNKGKLWGTEENFAPAPCNISCDPACETLNTNTCDCVSKITQACKARGFF